MTLLVTVASSAEALAETQHLLTRNETAWVLWALAALAGTVGIITHQNTTSLVAPRSADGTPLLPVPPGFDLAAAAADVRAIAAGLRSSGVLPGTEATK